MGLGHCPHPRGAGPLVAVLTCSANLPVYCMQAAFHCIPDAAFHCIL
jgi:hypothetical protein